MDEKFDDSKILVLIESVSNLSRITSNHDTILTKLVDDHEMRLRATEKCIYGLQNLPALECRINNIEINGSKPAEQALHQLEIIEIRMRKMENWRWYIIGISIGLSVALSIVFQVVYHI